jgi:hypothetical protein
VRVSRQAISFLVGVAFAWGKSMLKQGQSAPTGIQTVAAIPEDKVGLLQRSDSFLLQTRAKWQIPNELRPERHPAALKAAVAAGRGKGPSERITLIRLQTKSMTFRSRPLSLRRRSTVQHILGFSNAPASPDLPTYTLSKATQLP